MKKMNFKTNARHIGQLGRELVTDFVTALVELIKNSYDADAECIGINVEETKTSSSRIILTDTGSGMTQDEFETKWMTIGTSNKLTNPYTPKGRKKAGKKGIGRFSVERLAERVTIYSFPDNAAPFYVEINWNNFEEIDIAAIKQRIEILKREPDISAAKFIFAQLEYLYLLPVVEDSDKEIIIANIGEDFSDYKKLFDILYLNRLENDLLPYIEKYENVEQLIEDVEVPLLEIERGQCPYYNELVNLYENHKVEHIKTGLIIIMERLRDEWTQKDIDKLQKELRLLVAPDFLEKDPFIIDLKAPGFRVEDEISVNEITDLSFAQVDAAVTDDGKNAYIHYIDKEGVDKTIPITYETPLKCGDFNFQLYYFIRDKENLGSGSYNTRYAGRILNTYCGVKIYRDNFRVKPYGDIGNDWLLLDQQKVRDTHGYLVGNNQTIGRVNISDRANPLLIDATNREGIIENQAYDQMREFVQLCITTISDFRREKFNERLAEKKRLEEEQEKIKEKKRKLQEKQKKLIELESKIEDEAKKNSDNKALNMLADYAKKSRQHNEEQNQYQEKYEENAEERYRTAQEILGFQESELAMYKNLATLGMLASEFGHETDDIINRVRNAISVTERCIQDIDTDISTKALRMLNIVTADFDRISSYSQMIIAFLRKHKREKTEKLDFGMILEEVCKFYMTILDEFNIKLKYNCEYPISYTMKQIDLESIIINMITNAYAQLKKCKSRIISIKFRKEGDRIILDFEDSGPGVPEGERERIFNAFVSTKEDGIGLGLNIVRGIVEQYGGEVSCDTSLELGGAHFRVCFMNEEI